MAAPDAVTPAAERDRRLRRLMVLSIATAVATIALKTGAWALTGSVGLLSDAAESIVNLVGASVGLVAVVWAARPADEEHAYGHEKANYLAAGIEGTLILVAAATIGFTAIDRLLHPSAVTDVGVGVAVSVLASLLNLVVGRLLVTAGRRDRSLTLEADGKHLLTDVWTSAGVVVGVALVALTGWQALDPLVALAVAVNIVVAGVGLVRRSADGLMDRALDGEELAGIERTLRSYTSDDVRFHALRTRRSGQRAFVSVHVLVPGAWTVQRGHDLVEELERDLRPPLEPVTITTHLEPLEDPASFADAQLDRSDRG
ncbi:cation diffusion facilitator family transporter [Patulibacter sp. SYSU D01012]|uniref:cation diffusion facilitator family transporter n=1 Tax=Patulibacter sp. SYSU D01012 TaxID=2817381 RepID=UPI001B306726|nr:cation diffusion facilitator family transporter [Patulibacter sp. SYSU D01012]